MFVITLRNYFLWRQRSLPGKRSVFWGGGQKGRSYNNLGKHVRVIWGSSPWNLRYLLSCLLFSVFFLSNTSESTLIIPKITPPPPPTPCCLSCLSTHTHTRWTLSMTVIQNAVADTTVPGEIYIQTLLDTMCGISKPPAMTMRMICTHAASAALYHCKGVFTTLHPRS